MNPRAALIAVLLLVASTVVIAAADVPAPPAELTFHQKPKPLPAGAITEDWEMFLGPRHNGTSSETHILKKFPDGGPTVVWEMKHGMSYASPAVSAGCLYYIHRVAEQERVECLRAESGERLWQFDYDAPYQDRYGYNSGPRCSPVVDGGRVYTYGASGWLHCLNTKDGSVVWKHDILTEVHLKQNFFGVGGTPLVDGNLLIVNVGAPDNQCVVAFDKITGEKKWGAGTDANWGPSYASPIPAELYGKHRVLVFAGGESRPPSGGLLSIDPASGAVDFSFPWRSKSFESVNAALPTVVGNDVFVSASYDTGGAMVHVTPEFKGELAWKTDELGAHFTTSIFRDGYIYGIDGRHMQNAQLSCVEAKTGKTAWRKLLTWKEPVTLNGVERDQLRGAGRGSFLWVENQVLLLGEGGDLLRLELTPEGCKELERTRLFDAQESWSPMVLSHGLLYIVQNRPDARTRAEPRLFCCDLRDEN